jgi:Zn finger protein HypA/HybF involved in hydrogenase expression
MHENPMSKQPTQLTKERATFENALGKTKCPKCGGKVLETAMPDVVCEKCRTQFILATRMDLSMFFGGGPSARLIEKRSQ